MNHSMHVLYNLKEFYLVLILYDYTIYNHFDEFEVRFRFVVFNATFNNISAISWRDLVFFIYKSN